MIRFLFIKSIRFYQKHLSHRKGYKCAHGVLHGDTTCSSAILNIIKLNSIFKWYSLSKKQFESCKNAKITLDKKKEKNKKNKIKECSDSCTGEACSHSTAFCNYPKKCNIIDSCDVPDCGSCF